MDVDFNKKLQRERSCLMQPEKMAEKVKSDKEARYKELVMLASLQMLARATTKRKLQKGDQEALKMRQGGSWRT
jgi:hypothetical protein